MIWIDFTLIGVIFIGLVIGLWRGVVKELFSVIFWLLATWVSFSFSREFSIILAPSMSQPSARQVASFIALLVITLSFGALIGFLFNNSVEKNELSLIDRFGGLFFAFVRSIIMVTVVIIVAGLTPLSKDSWWNESVLIPPVHRFTVWLRDHISSEPAEFSANSSAHFYKTMQVKK